MVSAALIRNWNSNLTKLPRPRNDHLSQSAKRFDVRASLLVTGSLANNQRKSGAYVGYAVRVIRLRGRPKGTLVPPLSVITVAA